MIFITIWYAILLSTSYTKSGYVHNNLKLQYFFINDMETLAVSIAMPSLIIFSITLFFHDILNFFTAKELNEILSAENINVHNKISTLNKINKVPLGSTLLCTYNL